MDASSLSAVLGGFLSGAKAERQAAEATFQELKDKQPDVLAGLLCQVLAGDPDTTRRQQCAIAFRNFLREFIFDHVDNVWVKLQPHAREEIKTTLLTTLVEEKEFIVKRAIGDIVGAIGDVKELEKSWPALLPTVKQMMASADPDCQTVGLAVAATLEPQLAEDFQENLPELAQLLARALESKNERVMNAAATLISQLVINENKKVKDALGVFALALTTLATDPAGDETTKIALLQTLIDIATESADYFTAHATDVIGRLILQARDTKQSEDVRVPSLEFVLTFVENKHKTVTRIPGLLDSVVETLMLCLLETEEDPEWFDQGGADEDINYDDEAAIHDMGETGLDRVAGAIDGAVIMPIIFAYVAQYIMQPDWQHKVAGLVAVCQTAEYMLEDKLESQLGELATVMVQHMEHEHYRVRFAACRTVAQLSLDHPPVFQENYHAIVMPALVSRFDDPIARIQAQAFAAFINFAESVDIEDLLQYIPVSMEKIFVRLDANFSLPSDTTAPNAKAVQKRHRLIREQCITSVAVVAGVLGDKFIEFAPRIMPFMKMLVTHAGTSETRAICGRALECLSVISYAVGYENVKDDAPLVIQALTALYKSQQDQSDDDPITEYIYEGLRRMASVLEKHFIDFVPDLLPTILERLVVDKYVANKLNPDDCTTLNDYSLVAAQDGSLSGVRTAKLDDIIADLSLLTVIVENCQGSYSTYIPDTIKAVVPLLEMKYSTAVRRQALLCMAELIGAAKDGHHAPTDQINSWVLSVVDLVLKTASNDYEVMECGVDHFAATLSGLASCLEKAGRGVLNAEHVRCICAQVWTLIQQSSDRRQGLEKSKTTFAANGNVGIDEETAEQFDDECNREQVFRENSLKVLAALMKNHPQEFLQSSATDTVKFIEQFIQESCSEPDRILACYVCCDILEILGTQGLSLIGNFVNHLIQNVHNPNCELRQAACYAMNLCMKISGIDQPIVATTVQRLVQLIRDPESAKKDNGEATDNAVSALFTAIVVQSHIFSQQDLNSYAELVLQHLPLVNDCGEGYTLHLALAEQLLKNEQSIFYNHFPRTIAVLAQVYKGICSTKAIDDAIHALVAKIGLQKVAAAMSGFALTEAQKRGFKKIERDFA